MGSRKGGHDCPQGLSALIFLIFVLLDDLAFGMLWWVWKSGDSIYGRGCVLMIFTFDSHVL